MKLLIKNFRCWEKTEFEFQKGKILLINGISGIGKSTIFESIYWCLYGKLRQVEPINKPNAKTYVEIILPWIRIIRSKKPNRIFVYYENQEYQGKTAENVIETEFGNTDQWLSACYIEQGKQNHFLNLNSFNKLELLNKFSFQDISPEEIINRINEDKKFFEDEIKNFQNKYDYHIKKFPNEDYHPELILNEKEFNNNEKDLNNYEKELKKLKLEKEKYIKDKIKLEEKTKRLNKIKNELIEPYKLPNWIYNIDEQLEKLNNIKEEIKLLENYKKYKPFIKKPETIYNDDDIKNIKENEKLYEYKFRILKNNSIKDENIENVINELKEKLKGKENNFLLEKKRELKEKLKKYDKIYKNCLNFVPEIEIEIKKPKEINLIEEKIEKLEEKIKNSLVCPECDNNLILKDDKLIKL